MKPYSLIKNTQGYALIVVLWLITLLTLIGGIAYSQGHTDIQITVAELGRQQAKKSAEAALWLMIEDMAFESAGQLERRANDQQQTTFNGNPVELSSADNAGKINLNYATPLLITGLLESAGLSPQQASQISIHIADWKDSDNNSTLSSSESAPYQRAGLGYTPKNHPFATVDELRLIAGLNDRVYRDIAPFLTIHGDHAQINFLAAKPELIARLSNITELEAKEMQLALQQDLLQNTINTFPDIPEYQTLYTSNTGSNFALTATSQYLDHRVSLEAVVAFPRNNRGVLYRILDWGVR